MFEHTDDASSSCLTYATSSARDEPFVPSTGTTRYDPLGRLTPSTSYKFPKEFDHFLTPRSRPLAPGLTTQRTLTMEHPLVTLFLSRVPSIPPALGRLQGEGWWTKALHSWTVNDVLDLTDADGNEVSLSALQEECIYVLAALKVFWSPKHPKHFTLWGKDWAPRTAERVHTLLLSKPCPIAYAYNWMSIDSSLWIIETEQVYAFPEIKDGKKAANGMLLRKRKSGTGKIVFDPLDGKSIEGVTDERPRKRVRTTTRPKKVEVVALNEEPTTPALLEELPLPGVIVSLEQTSSGSSTAVTSNDEAAPGSTAGSTKLELVGVDAPQPTAIISSPRSTSAAQPPPPATRRSARQAHKHKRGETASPSTPSTKLDSPVSDIAPSLAAASPPVSSLPLSETQEERPVITRARSSSSSCASEVTVVSNASVESVATVVDEEASSKSFKVGKEKIITMEEVIEKKEKNKENEKDSLGKLRASGRTRKPAIRKVEAEEAEAAVEEALVVVDGPTTMVARGGRSRRKTGGRR